MAAYRSWWGHLSQPCYGLAVPQNADQLGDMADLARVYVGAVKAAQPVGPNLLVGASVFGSLLAALMVSQLEGEEERGFSAYAAVI